MSSPRNPRSRSGHADASGTRGSASPYQSSPSPVPADGGSSGGSLLSVISGLRPRDIGGAILGRDPEEVEDRALDREPRRKAEVAARLRTVGDAQVEQKIEKARRRA